MKTKIFIDQGHNPNSVNGGAQGNGLEEATINYHVGLYLAAFLIGDPRFDTIVSRIRANDVLGYDTPSSLAKRVALANDWEADYFISIHTNANENSRVNGSEIYLYDRKSEAFPMAEKILYSIVSYVKTKNNGLRINPRFYVLRKTKMPAMLIELAYLTNTDDAEKLKNDQFIFAYAIYQGILAFFGYELNNDSLLGI